MNFDLTEEQEMVRDTFARFLDENSSPTRVRAALPSGFDPALWQGLAELGAFVLRVPEEAGGLGLGLFDAAVIMEEAGRTLASGPLAEALVAARLLAQFGGDADLLGQAIGGDAVVTLAMRDVAEVSRQWVAGGLVADAVVARKGNDVVLISVPAEARVAEENLASTPIAEIDLGALPATVLASGEDALATFAAGLEEWKLLIGAALSGLSREALKMAAAYAGERKAFGVFIGTFQAISHPLADLIAEIDSGKFLVWKAIRSIADGEADAAGQVSLAVWWNAETAARTVTQSLHTFGGIGLTTEHDIHLYNLRAKAWPLVAGDPQQFLIEAGRRFYGGESASLPDAGDRFMSLQIIDEDQYVPGVYYDAQPHRLVREAIGTRYAMVAVRTLVDPNDPADLAKAHALQDAIKVEQADPGSFVPPKWDKDSQDEVRDALLILARHMPDTSKGFGPDQPIESNGTPEGRKANRRVEFHIESGGPAPAP